jgi:hypothetical protein
MKLFLAASILGIASLSIAAPVPRPAPTEGYTKLAEFDEYSIGYKEDSYKLIPSKNPGSPGVQLDVIIVLTIPIQQEQVPPKTGTVGVKAYKNTILMDCEKDEMVVLQSTALDLAGDVINTVSGNRVLANRHNPKSAISVVMDTLICPALAEGNKFPPVTK